jgi:hypothetical protein
MKQKHASHFQEHISYWTGDWGGRDSAILGLCALGYFAGAALHIDGDEIFTVVNDLILIVILHQIGVAHANEPLVMTLSLAYPVGDLVLLFGVTVVLLDRSSATARIPLTFLLLGDHWNFVADLTFSYQNLKDTYQTGGTSDQLFCLSYFLLVIAAPCSLMRQSS